MEAVGLDPFAGKTLRGFAAELDGEVVGVAGVIYTKPPQAFTHMADNLRRYPKFILQFIDYFADWMKQHHTVLYAVPSCNEKNAKKVLERAGFRQYRGEVYKWQTP